MAKKARQRVLEHCQSLLHQRRKTPRWGVVRAQKYVLRCVLAMNFTICTYLGILRV